MNEIPNAISPEELAWLQGESTVSGVRPLDAAEMQELTIKQIGVLRKMLKELSACTSPSIGGERWEQFRRSQRNIRAAIHNLEKSISL